MNPGHPKILTCPHCGGKKQVLSLASGNTFGAKMWSDNKRIYPMLPSPSFIQKCPQCGDYFLLSRQEKEEYAGRGFCLNQGRLSYEDLKEAYFKLSQLPDLTDDEQTTMLFYLVWAYNDRYNSENPAERADQSPCENEMYEEDEELIISPMRGDNSNDEWGSDYDGEADSTSKNDKDDNSEGPISDATEASKEVELMEVPDEERIYMEEIVLKLLGRVSDSLMKAELYREIGMFEEASEMLKQVSSEGNFLIRFKRVMAEYIDKKDTKAFNLTRLMYASNED